MKIKIIKVVSIITVIPLLIQFFIKQRKKSQLRKRVLQVGSDDYANTAKNIANSISKSRLLYKELIVKIHPDKFPDERKIIATELSARITSQKKF
jgi:hypothetical protein